MLVEDTGEHRALFGEEGAAVLYFNDIDQLVRKTRWLLEHPDEARMMRFEVRKLIQRGGNTYADRLSVMLADRADRS